MKSMTGFGRANMADTDNNAFFSIEINSVNKKNLDIRYSSIRELSTYEQVTRKEVSKKVSRGYVSVKVDFKLGDSKQNKSIKLNAELLTSLIDQCKEIQLQNNLSNNINLSDFFKIEGVIQAEEIDYLNDDLYLKVLKGALIEFDNMRFTEGSNMKNDLIQRMQKLEKLLKDIEPLVKELPQKQMQKLLNRLKELEMNHSYDDERIMREMVIYTDKADVSEEITRLKSHFKQAFAFFEDSKPVGRSLEFLLQEMFREITTLGNKASTDKVSPLIISFKTELEKIREQIQNIE